MPAAHSHPRVSSRCTTAARLSSCQTLLSLFPFRTVMAVESATMLLDDPATQAHFVSQGSVHALVSSTNSSTSLPCKHVAQVVIVVHLHIP